MDISKLTPQEKIEARKIIKQQARERLVRDFGDYTQYCILAHRETWEPARHHRLISEKIEAMMRGEIKRLMVFMPPRHGKQVSDDTPVLTTAGWKTHGELRAGDYVFNHKGHAVRVTQMHRPYTEDVEVTFSNGEVIHCHENHEWVVYDRTNQKTRTLETAHMMSGRIAYGPESGRGHRYRYMLPSRSPIQQEEKLYFVHPYVMGAWLGDGTNTKPCITGTDDLINQEVLKHYNPLAVHIHKTTGVHTWNYEGLRADLHNYGMCVATRTTQKHIPDEYYIGSIPQRLDLLAGLIDTDGSCGKDGRYRFINTDKRLVDDVVRLISTFGWRTSISSTEPATTTSGIVGKKVVYCVGFTPDMEIPCRLKRKRNKPRQQQRISITNIAKAKPKIGRCATVEGGIYLIGNTLLPTHNSMQITETLPSFYLGKNPEGRVIVLSYSAELATRFGRFNRAKITDYGNRLFDVRVSRKEASATSWSLEGHRGGLLSVGIGGGVTGQGADLLIIDDPVKNREEAESKIIRDKIHEEYKATAYTRLQAGGAIILVMTRWHEDDLAGRILSSEGAEEWDVLSLPALAEKDDLMGRAEGEPLWPEAGYDEEWAETTKRDVGSYTFAALYQQRPAPAGGGILQRSWWKWYDVPPESVTKIISVDASFKGNVDSDNVSIQVWGKRNAYMYLLDSDTRTMDFPETLKSLRAMHDRHPDTRAIYIEDKANGSAIISMLQKEIPGVIPVEPYGGKIARAHAVSGAIESGNVFLPRNHIGDELANEAAAFPNGAHDDRVDAMTQGLNRLIYHWAEVETYQKAVKWEPDMWEDYDNASEATRVLLIRKWGDPFGR